MHELAVIDTNAKSSTALEAAAHAELSSGGSSMITDHAFICNRREIFSTQSGRPGTAQDWITRETAAARTRFARFREKAAEFTACPETPGFCRAARNAQFRLSLRQTLLADQQLNNQAILCG
jgi:hypothetical protein